MSIVDSESFLTLHYRLSSHDGTDFVNTFDDKPATMTLGSGQLSEALECRLLGLREGSRQTFELSPGEAFGPHDPLKLQWVGRELLNRLGDTKECYAVGDVVQFPTPDRGGNFAGSVVRIGSPEREDALLFDFNHPLAGLAVRFEVQMIGVL